MSTREVVTRYFDELTRRGPWETVLADDFTFTRFISPVKAVTGKAAYLEATRRFYSTIRSLELRDLIVEGAKACAFTSYELQAPGGPVIRSDVAELFTVSNGKIGSLAIYFDTAPFPK